MTTARQSEPEHALDAELLGSPRFEAFFHTLRWATSIIGGTDQALREADAGIGAREFDALAFLLAFGPLRPSELLRLVVLTHSPQTLSSILDRLEARGLVERSPHPTDTRAVLISATDAGATLAAEVFPSIDRSVVAPFVTRYTDEEIETLNALLGRK